LILQKKNILLTLLCFSAVLAFSQPISLQITSPGNSKEISTLNYKKKFNTRDAAIKEVENVLLSLQYKGYLLASADTVYQDDNTLRVVINENSFYKVAYLRLGNLNPNLASKLGISEKLFVNKPFRYREVARSINRIIVHYENNGFPFADVQLDSVQVSDNKVSAVFNVQPHKMFRIDSIKIEGNVKVNRKFLYRYLSIREGMPYNEEALASISQKVRQLSFLTEKRRQEVRPTEKMTKLYMFLDKKNASQFDGIVGLLPDAVTKKTIITGDVKLKLVNGVFRNGETFDLQWRRLKSQTSDFSGRIIYPYLFGTPVGTDYAIKIYRRDTTFIDINNDIGIQYYFKGLNNFKIFYKNRTTNLISTSGLATASTLPDYADITTDSYGFGLTFEQLDYRFNPHKGISINTTAQTGNRNIRKNPRVNDILYNNLLLHSTQYQLNGAISAYIQLHRNNVLRLGVQGASVFGNASLFTNEVFRIGGLRTLRGFDEESIFASSYVIPTIEYRFLFSQNSNLLLFAEGAWYENTANGRYVHDTPVSVGAGINFDTKAGILTMNYAIGNQFGNGFDIRSGKIHIGLIALL
jgi:outer membrane protein assembly factor BamA